jgi:rhodanese-related sulfurtransferase
MDAMIDSTALAAALQSEHPPLVIDVRRPPAFSDSREMVDGALRRDPDRVSAWARTLPATVPVVVYCVHGHAVSQGAAAALNASGRTARYLEGGIEHWKDAGLPLRAKAAGPATLWVTRERPKIDRIACPWLVRRFVDPDAGFLYVPKDAVLAAAAQSGAAAYDVPGVEFTHAGDLCSFDAFLRVFRLRDPALDALAAIVRGADTGRMDLAPQSAGLLAVSLGLSRLYADDLEMLSHGMQVYDALYAWCKGDQPDTAAWNPGLVQ